MSKELYRKLQPCLEALSGKKRPSDGGGGGLAPKLVCIRQPVLERMFIQGPHAHSNLPARLDDFSPDRRQDDLAVWTYQVIMTCLNMWAKSLHRREDLFNGEFHILEKLWLTNC